MDTSQASPVVSIKEEPEEKCLSQDISVKSEDPLSSDTEEQTEVELNEEEKKIRFEKLTQLLSKSKAYTNYLQLKLTKAKQDEENAAKRARRFPKVKALTPESKSPRKRPLQEQNVDASEDETGLKKAKLSSPQMTAAIGAENGENVVPGTGRILQPIVALPRAQLFINGTLRPYQEEGVEWLKALYENGVNGILADEMGLGKTVQVIAMLCHLYSVGCVGPYLVICPLSTLHNWKKEFQRFAPEVPTLVYYGNEKERIQLRWKLKRRYMVKGQKCFPVVLTSYQIPMMDSLFLCSFRWKYLVVDEAQRMKNHKCKFVRKLKELRTDNRLLLTGTPLQNDLTELWALLNFLMPELFNDSGLFEVLFDVRELQNESNNEKIVEQEKSQHVLSTLHEIMAPFMLRRVKADVELDLPPKKEVLVYAPMTEIQHQLYRATLEYNLKLLTRKQEDSECLTPDGKRAPRKCRKITNYAVYFSKSSQEDSNSEAGDDAASSSSSSSLNENEVNVSVGNYHVTVKMHHPMMQLRKIVNHPYLVHFPMVPGTKQPLIDEGVITSSGKFLVLDTMLRKLKEGGHKVLLFSTFVMVLDMIEELLDIRGLRYCRLDGARSLDSREESIQLFNNDPDVFVFLISTRAGGLGLNLTSADTVIIFDSDWNPQVDLQAQDRCHRIGQTRPVMVYRFVTRGTIDQKIVERATAKRKLEKMVIHNGKFKMNCFEKDLADPNELMILLNSKDHDFEVDSHTSGVFTEEELDFLLDRSNIVAPKRESLDRKSAKFRVIGKRSPTSIF